MNAPRHQRLYTIFRAACELQGDELTAYLDQQCGDEPGLRQEVEGLLARDETNANFLDTPILEADADALFPATATTLPQRIGDYQIQRVLGEGGMGVVYLAEQDTPRRPVALKVLRFAAGSSIIRRFEHEAELLGRLQHPGIAQIYEAGSAELGTGTVPFFAMEYVEGLPLLKYAQEAGLDPKGKLQLLVNICDAVQHAHQKGVIHRDLKPANILVTESGQPKVLDFGVGRATDANLQLATMNTSLGDLVGTVPYMSPEQASGRPDEIDTRSDVYALGVVGYELLADQLPYDLRHQMIHDAVRTIQDEPPKSLSAVDPVYRGDVDTIFAKALEKDRDQRYASVSELKQDLENYLQHQPISARPAGTVYRLRKLIARHRVAAISAAIILVSLLAGIVATSWQWLRAERALVGETAARQQATLEADKARVINEFLVNMLASASPQEKGKDLLVVDVLEDAENQIADQFQNQPLLAAQIHHTLGVLYRHLGRLEQAEQQHRAALSIRERLLPSADRAIIESNHNLANVLYDQGQTDAAEELGQKTLELQIEVLGEDHEETIHTMNNLAMVWWQKGELPRAEEMVRKALQLYRQRLGEEDAHTQTALGNLALILHQQGRLDEAEPLYRSNLKTLESLKGPDHPSTINVLNNLAALLKMQDRVAESEQMFLIALPRSIRTLGNTHPDTLNLMRNLAHIVREQGRTEEAYQRSVEVLEKAKKSMPADHWFVAQAKGDVGWSLCQLEKHEEAAPLLEESLAGMTSTMGADHVRTAAVRNRLADCYRALGQSEKADQLAAP